MKKQISIIDYGQGNLGSIKNMLNFLGYNCAIISKPVQVAAAEKLILPGVGSFDAGMQGLEQRGLVEALHRRVIEDKVPILGICLGAQLMTSGSDEGNRQGLGWFEAKTVRFQFDAGIENLPIPNIGWRKILTHGDTHLMSDWSGPIKFYFVHSYYIDGANPENVVFTSFYGRHYVAGLQLENIYSVQFHPEKSHKYGLHLMKRFADV